MKSQVLILLTLLILCFSGCIGRAPLDRPDPIKITYQFVRCPEPEPPTYTMLNSNVHIGSKENLDILLKNIITRKKYINSLLGCISCYTIQIKEEEKCKLPE